MTACSAVAMVPNSAAAANNVKDFMLIVLVYGRGLDSGKEGNEGRPDGRSDAFDVFCGNTTWSVGSCGVENQVNSQTMNRNNTAQSVT